MIFPRNRINLDKRKDRSLCEFEFKSIIQFNSKDKLRENTYQRMDFAVPVGYGVKLKENDKLEKYQVCTRKLVKV